MVDHLNVSYLYKKRGVFYFSKRVPCDVRSYYKSDRIVICLKTKSNALAIRASKSLYQRLDAPALPIHDSFIMHHGFSTYGELEEAMRRAYHDRFHTDIKVKGDMVVQVKPAKDYPIGDKNVVADTSIYRWNYKRRE